MAVRAKTRPSSAKHPRASVGTAIVDAARRNHVPLWVMAGVKLIETGKDSGVGATSPAGARGPFQFMPATASSLGIKDPNNVEEAANGAAKLLASYRKKYGSWGAAFEAYNGGPGAVGGGYAYTERDVVDKLRENGFHRLADEASSQTTLVGWLPEGPAAEEILKGFGGAIPDLGDLLPGGETPGSKLGEAIGPDVGNVLGGIVPEPILQASAATTAFLSMLTDINFWIRVGEAVGAFILIYLALKELL